MASAVEARADRYASETYHSAVALQQAGNMEKARQTGRLSFLRDYSSTRSLYLYAQHVAQEAAAEARAVVAERRTTLGGHQERLEKELASWRTTLDGSLVIYAAETAYSSAQIEFEKGQRLLEVDEFAQAAEAFHRADESVNDLVRIMDEYAYERSEKGEIWRGWVDKTVESSKKSGTTAVIVDKVAHRLYLVRGGVPIRTYPCELGYNSAGQKMQAGDGATPEGEYRITHVITQGSRYYKALRLDYPNAADRRRFAENQARGVVASHSGIGALIEIHAGGEQGKDWTDGCIALRKEDMDDLVRQVTEGTRVTIVRISDQWP